MYYYGALFFILLTAIAGAQDTTLVFSEAYRDFDTKLLAGGGNWNIERAGPQTFLYKRYRPETKRITHQWTFRDEELKILHGPYRIRYDDGTVVQQGLMVDGKREGPWTEDVWARGHYVNNRRTGEWTAQRDNGQLKWRKNYRGGELDGLQVHYDSTGAVAYEETYAAGELLSSTAPDSTRSEVMPMYTGCEEITDYTERKACADRKLRLYIYGNIKYPSRAQRMDITGEALVTFVIERDGSVVETAVLHGVSDDIEAEVLRVIAGLARWSPGLRGGQPVRAQFNLPVQFKLQ